MLKNLKEGNYNEVGNQVLAGASQVYQAAVATGGAVLEKVKGVDYNRLYQQASQNASSVYQGAAKVGLTLYSMMPNTKPFLDASRDFYDAMYGKDTDEQQEEKNNVSVPRR